MKSRCCRRFIGIFLFFVHYNERNFIKWCKYRRTSSDSYFSFTIFYTLPFLKTLANRQSAMKYSNSITIACSKLIQKLWCQWNFRNHYNYISVININWNRRLSRILSFEQIVIGFLLFVRKKYYRLLLWLGFYTWNIFWGFLLEIFAYSFFHKAIWNCWSHTKKVTKLLNGTFPSRL